MSLPDITAAAINLPTTQKSNWWDFLKKDPAQAFGIGNLSTTAKVLGGSLGAYGIASALGKADSLNKFLGIGGGDATPVGYQGGIPQYTASRSVLTPPVGEGGPSAPDRRPGSGGRRYFTDMTYTPTGNYLGGYKPPVASVGSYMPEDQITALMEALTQSQAAGTNTGNTNTGNINTGNTNTGNTNTGNTNTGNTNTGTTTTTNPYANYTDSQWRDMMDRWIANNPGATKAQIDAALVKNQVPSRLWGYAYSIGDALNTMPAADTYAPATAATGFVTPNAPTGPGGADLYEMLRQNIQYAGANTRPGEQLITKSEADQIFDIAKTLQLSVPQLTEQLNNYIYGNPALGQGSWTDADVANAIKAYFPDEASNYFGLYANQNYAKGGLASIAHSDNYAAGGGIASRGYYLGGATDGMADEIPANIDGRQPAALSDGEFVMPADVVSHLGNGNSDAGAKVLYDMMERVRRARTGNPRQGRQIDPNKFTPA